MFVCLRVLPLEDRTVPPGQDRYSPAVGRNRSRPPAVRPQTTLFQPPLGDSGGFDELTISTTRRQTTGHLVHYLTYSYIYIVFIPYYLLNTDYLLFKPHFTPISPFLQLTQFNLQMKKVLYKFQLDHLEPSSDFSQTIYIVSVVLGLLSRLILYQKVGYTLVETIKKTKKKQVNQYFPLLTILSILTCFLYYTLKRIFSCGKLYVDFKNYVINEEIIIIRCVILKNLKQNQTFFLFCKTS